MFWKQESPITKTSISAEVRRTPLRWLMAPCSTLTRQRPQRPCPPHGRFRDMPASTAASDRSVPISTSTTCPVGLKTRIAFLAVSLSGAMSDESQLDQVRGAWLILELTHHASCITTMPSDRQGCPQLREDRPGSPSRAALLPALPIEQQHAPAA